MEPSNIATFYSQFGICQVGGCTSNTSHFKFIMIFFNFEILKKENLFISIFLDDSKTLMRLRLHIYFVKTLFKGINPPPHPFFISLFPELFVYCSNNVKNSTQLSAFNNLSVSSNMCSKIFQMCGGSKLNTSFVLILYKSKSSIMAKTAFLLKPNILHVQLIICLRVGITALPRLLVAPYSYYH